VAANVTVKLNGEVIRQFLRGDVGRVPADLMRRAKNVQRTAGPGYRSEGFKGARRYRATVRAGRFASNPRQSLTQALDAARSDR
jgi:hypothetical protein